MRPQIKHLFGPCGLWGRGGRAAAVRGMCIYFTQLHLCRINIWRTYKFLLGLILHSDAFCMNSTYTCNSCYRDGAPLYFIYWLFRRESINFCCIVCGFVRTSTVTHSHRLHLLQLNPCCPPRPKRTKRKKNRSNKRSEDYFTQLHCNIARSFTSKEEDDYLKN